MSNSLPERIRVFAVVGVLTGKIHHITFDAGEAVRIKVELRRGGVDVELQEHIATRGFQSTGVIEFRCYPCSSHHLVSAEAVDGPSEVHDGCCDAATKRAERERRELDPRWFEEAGKALEATEADPCPHVDDVTLWEDVEVQHEGDEQPTAFNPLSGAIRWTATVYHLVTVKCRRCAKTDVVTRDCDCKPDVPCRCVGPCRC